MKIRTLALTTFTAAAVVTACAAEGPSAPPGPDRVECDRGDLAERDPDCGYWDASGVFVLWYWVNPTSGGVSPLAWRPKVPAGGSRTRPANARDVRPKIQPVPPARGRPAGQQQPRPPAGRGQTPRPGGGAVVVPRPAPPPPRAGR